MVDVFNVSYTVFKQAASLYTVHYYPRPSMDGYVLGAGNNQIIYTTIIKDSSDINDFTTTLEPTAQISEKEGDVLAKSTLGWSGNVQKKFDLTDSNYIYVGTAPAGIATSDIGWTIRRISLDASGNPIDEKYTYQEGAIWDDRSTSLYI